MSNLLVEIAKLENDINLKLNAFDNRLKELKSKISEVENKVKKALLEVKSVGDAFPIITENINANNRQIWTNLTILLTEILTEINNSRTGLDPILLGNDEKKMQLIIPMGTNPLTKMVPPSRVEEILDKLGGPMTISHIKITKIT